MQNENIIFLLKKLNLEIAVNFSVQYFQNETYKYNKNMIYKNPIL